MDFLRARSQAEIDERQDEIVNACDKLFSEYGFEGVNYKAISQLTSFSRPTIYNYFKTKEEILLALLKRELLDWREAFARRIEAAAHMTKEEYSACLAQSLAARGKMFRLLAMLFSALETGSRLESLTGFHESVAAVFGTISESMGKFFPAATEQAKWTFQASSVAYLLGLHAMTSLSEKQRTAVRLAGMQSDLPGFEALCYHGLLAFLGEL